jgi:hypothetical protein
MDYTYVQYIDAAGHRDQVELTQIEHSTRFQELDQSIQNIARCILGSQDAFAELLDTQTKQIAQLHVQSNSRMIEELEQTRATVREALNKQNDSNHTSRVKIR